MSSEDAPAAPILEVGDPYHVPRVFADWVVTVGELEGVLNVTLGTLDHSLVRSSEDLPRVVICGRLRFTPGLAERLFRMLGQILAQTPSPSEPPPDASPPRNQIFH